MIIRTRTSILLAVAGLAAAGCVSIDAWPFKSEKGVERSRAPANAVEYQCAANRKFYVRKLDGGASVWLILPEREVRLDRQGGDNRYSNGVAVLELNGADAALSDGAAAYNGCKTTAPTAAAG